MTCHCNPDHCPACGCEEHEADCGERDHRYSEWCRCEGCCAMREAMETVAVDHADAFCEVVRALGE